MCATPLSAEPWLAPGDLRIRSDIQLLADAGVIDMPVTTWPLVWADVARSVDTFTGALELDYGEAAALRRIRARLHVERRSSELAFAAVAAVAEDPRSLRTFENTARERKEIQSSVAWMGERFAVKLQGQIVEDDDGNTDSRNDGTYAGAVLGNTMFSFGWMDRWWGPGWEGSLAYSSNARPIPTIAMERRLSTPFRSRWLSWIGPWRAILSYGKLEHDRGVPDANLLGFRFVAKPLKDLELAVTRTAQWCGDGRPCDAESLWQVIKGKSNLGDEGVSRNDEPGNQLAGFDLRWNAPFFDAPYAFYMQGYAEDELDSRPSEWMIQYGLEGWGDIGTSGLAFRWHFEATNTAVATRLKNATRWVAQRYNIAYNNSFYPTGYRFRGRAIGHPMDGDGKMFSLGFMLLERDGDRLNILLRATEINRNGAPEPAHSVSATPQDIWNAEITYTKATRYGEFLVRTGYERIDDDATGKNDTNFDVELQWRVDFGFR
jgi:hypothetical protein